MTAQQEHALDLDEERDIPAAHAFVARLFEEMRDAEQQAQQARARAMAAADRVRLLARWGREPRKGERRGR